MLFCFFGLKRMLISMFSIICTYIYMIIRTYNMYIMLFHIYTRTKCKPQVQKQKTIVVSFSPSNAKAFATGLLCTT